MMIRPCKGRGYSKLTGIHFSLHHSNTKDSIMKNNPWKLYDDLIATIPPDIMVRDCCVGTFWTYVDADCCIGVSHTFTGGGKRTHEGLFSGLPLREVAALSKSWNWKEASLGIAALNAWYSQKEKVRALGGVFEEEEKDPLDGSVSHSNKDPFYGMKDVYRGKKVTVIGHFPDVEAMADDCELTVLERNCRSPLDTPDPACEYLLPSQDFVMATGTTLINKTAPRIFALSQNATLILVGPSVVPSPLLFDYGVNVIAGRVAVNVEKVKTAVKQGTSFSDALQMFSLAKLTVAGVDRDCAILGTAD
jgi:uncharacterized protein (DUF4213/DUF364 family)